MKTVLWLTPRGHGQLVRQLLHVIKNLGLGEKIEIVVRGQEYREGYADGLKARRAEPEIVFFDEIGPTKKV